MVSSLTSRSPARATPCRGSSGTRRATAPTVSTTTRWCSRPRASLDRGAAADGAVVGFNWAAGGTGSGVLDATGPRRMRRERDPLRQRLLAEQGRDGERRGSARRVGHDDGREPDGPLGHLGREPGRVKQVFVSRLVTSPAPRTSSWRTTAQPISIDANDSTRPDITFYGNTPYVTWREDIGGGVAKAFSGHFMNPLTLRDSTRPTCR